MYRVLRPFTMGGERKCRNTVIDDGIEKCRNFRALVSGKYISSMADRKGSKYLNGLYVAIRSFNGPKETYRPGDLIDIRSVNWRNVNALLGSGYLRYATEKDVARHATHSPLARTGEAPPGLPSKPLVWKSKAWLVDRYVKMHASMPEMAREAGCSVSSIWGALKNAGIETRPRGRPTPRR
jgi:hypothetical protein